MKNKNKAVFIDRDGTINEEVQYLANLQDFKLLSGIGEAIKLLNENGFKIECTQRECGILTFLAKVVIL
jgi:D-glycero-D-manno-heptose 1,7-bisphosphate phosphatase